MQSIFNDDTLKMRLIYLRPTAAHAVNVNRLLGNPDMTARKKRYPLPKRFNVALSDQAYANLRALNDKWGLGNNYLLEVLLMQYPQFVNPDKMDDAYRAFIAEWGTPAASKK